MSSPSAADNSSGSKPRRQWPAYAAVSLSALDVVAAVVQLRTSGPRALWWAVAAVGALIVALAGRWLSNASSTSSLRRPAAYTAIAMGAIALIMGLLAGSGLILRTPKPAAAVTFPRPGDTVGVCERLTGTSAGIPTDQTLVLAVRDRTSGQPENYLWNIQDWDTGNRLDPWSGAVYFNIPGETYDVRVYMVSIDEVKDERTEVRNQKIWHKTKIPSHWLYLTTVSVVGRKGLGTSSC